MCFNIATHRLFGLQNVHEQIGKFGSMPVIIPLSTLSGDFIPFHVCHQHLKQRRERQALLDKC